MHTHEPVRAAIWHCLNNYDFENATFLAERLCAQAVPGCGSSEAHYLLATCYYRSGKQVQACDVLKSLAESAESRLLLARCYVELNKVKAAENTLLDASMRLLKPLQEQLQDVERSFGELACFALQLLGTIYQETQRVTQAKEAFAHCLRLNPFLFAAFQRLCDLGDKPDAGQLFQLRASHRAGAVVGCGGAQAGCDAKDAALHPHHLPQQRMSEAEAAARLSSSPSTNSIITRSRLARLTRGQDLLAGGGAGHRPDSSPDSIASHHSTPDESPVMTPSIFGGAAVANLPAAPSKKFKARRDHDSPLQQAKPFVINQANNSATSSLGTSALTMTPSPGPSGSANGQRVRRSTRLYTNNNGSVKENEKSGGKKAATPKSPRSGRKGGSARATKAATLTAEMNEKNLLESCLEATTVAPVVAALHTNAGVKEFLGVLGQIGQAYLHLAHYECRKAIHLLDRLSERHYKTGWVLCAKGKAFYELSDYKMAVRLYEECRELEPSRLQGMEVLSTAYWYLENEVALSALCHEMQEMSRNSVETCLALGNCFSQQREHDTAIKFFKRAVQLHDKCAYAFTLLGHEHVQTEELEWGLTCFRTAIRLDPRHYNAWLGLGSIYYKQERYQLADLHFKMAYKINPHSSVVMNFVAVSLQALKRSDEAMKLLNKAIRANPDNPICKFNKAKILFANEKFEDALKELEELKELVPKEAQVYFLAGKVHAKLGNTHLELMHFSWMMDLDPKGANSQIKEALDPALNRTVASVASQSSGLLEATEAAMATDPPAASAAAAAAAAASDSLHEAAGMAMNLDLHDSSDESL